MKTSLLLRIATTVSLLLPGILFTGSRSALRAQTTAPIDGAHITFTTTTAGSFNFSLKVSEGSEIIPWIDLNKNNVCDEGEKGVYRLFYSDYNFAQVLPFPGSYTVYVQNITDLDLNFKQLTALDVSSCTTLTHLACASNQLTTLDVSYLTALVQLFCIENQLTSLNVTGCTALRYLDCYENQLTALDVSTNTALEMLACRDNPLTTLDVSHNPALTLLNCAGNQLTAVDVSQNPALHILDCSRNQLTALDVSHNPAIIGLDCYDNQLTVLDVSKNTKLENLQCYNNQLSTLDISLNTALTEVHCYNNSISSLVAAGATALFQLFCQNNQLSSLDLSQNAALVTLNCSHNQFTALDVSKNLELQNLHCSGNQFTTLDVSKNTKLFALDCSGNQLTALDVSQNPELADLLCYNNLIEDAAMTDLVNALPDRTAIWESNLVVYDKTIPWENNICTKDNVTKAKAKAWVAMAYLGPGEYSGIMMEPYEGIDLNATYAVHFSASEGGTLTATVDGSAIESGAVVERGKEVLFTAAVTQENYQLDGWSINDKTLTQTVEGEEVNFVGNTYTLRVKEATDVKVTFKDHTGVEALRAAAVTVYPNPANNVLNVSGLAAASEVRLVSLAGQVVATAQTNAQGCAAIEVSTLPEGEYLLITPAATRKVVLRR